MGVALRIILIKRAPGRKMLTDIVGHNFTTEISLATESIMTQLFLGIREDFLTLSHLCSFSTFIKSSLVLPLPSPHLPDLIFKCFTPEVLSEPEMGTCVCVCVCVCV